MSRSGTTEYFLHVEHLLLDEHLKAAQDRTAALKSLAVRQCDIDAIRRVVETKQLIARLRRRLRQLADKPGASKMAVRQVVSLNKRRTDRSGALQERRVKRRSTRVSGLR